MKHKQQQSDTELADALLRAGVYGSGGQPSMVDAVIEECLGPKAALLGRRGKKRPSHKFGDTEEKAEARANRSRHTKSLNPIAQLLHCEGFNEFAAFGVLHYAQDKLWGKQWRQQVDQKRQTLAERCRVLDADQRKAVGGFIHEQAEASFQAGLRIGLLASLWTLSLIAEREARR